MALEGKSLSSSFLSSPHGIKANQITKDDIFCHDEGPNYPAFIYYWPPETVKLIGGGEMPFAWAELGDNGEFLGVAVIFGYWVIVWPLFEDTDARYSAKRDSLNRLCFLNWFGQVMNQLQSAPSDPSDTR